MGIQNKAVGEAYKKERSLDLELEKSLECGVSPQRQERLTRTREDRTLYMNVYVCG